MFTFWILLEQIVTYLGSLINKLNKVILYWDLGPFAAVLVCRQTKYKETLRD